MKSAKPGLSTDAPMKRPPSVKGSMRVRTLYMAKRRCECFNFPNSLSLSLDQLVNQCQNWKFTIYSVG